MNKEFHNYTNIIKTYNFRKNGKLWMSLGPSKNGHVTFPIQEVWHLLSWNDQLLLSKPPSILIMIQIVQIVVAYRRHHTYHSPHMFKVTWSNWCLSDWYLLYIFGAVTFLRLCLCFPDCQSIKKILMNNVRPWSPCCEYERIISNYVIGA